VKIPRDLAPQKVVADDLCVSLVTLWRARRSDIPGFPPPVILRNQVFWKRSDLDRLENALLQYRGRVAFERVREAEAKMARLKVQAAQWGRRKRRRCAPRPQPDLFDRDG
jgi:hypothetical protein